MAHTSWGAGWPTNNAYLMGPINATGTQFPAGIRKELVELITLLVNECKKRGYVFGIPGNPSYGCWGFANRPIGGTTVPSNHSWGLAVDINAPRNPQSTTFKTDMPSWMPALWKSYGFRWGGDYKPPTKYDTMHYEFMGSMTDATFYTNKARMAFAAPPPVVVPPPPIVVPPVVEDEVTPADINLIVAAVNATLTPQIQACMAESQKATAAATGAAKLAQDAKQVANSAYNMTLELSIEEQATQRQVSVIGYQQTILQEQNAKLSGQLTEHDQLVRGQGTLWSDVDGKSWLDDLTWLEIMRAKNDIATGGTAVVDTKAIAKEVRKEFAMDPLT